MLIKITHQLKWRAMFQPCHVPQANSFPEEKHLQDKEQLLNNPEFPYAFLQKGIRTASGKMNPEQIQQAQAMAKEWEATCKQREQPALGMVNPAPATYPRALMRQTTIPKLPGTNF